MPIVNDGRYRSGRTPQSGQYADEQQTQNDVFRGLYAAYHHFQYIFQPVSHFKCAQGEYQKPGQQRIYDRQVKYDADDECRREQTECRKMHVNSPRV